MSKEDLVRRVRSLDDKSLMSLLTETEASKSSSKDSFIFSRAIEELAKRDPEAALSWFSPETMAVQEVGWGEVAKVLAKSNPEILERWASSELIPRASGPGRAGPLNMVIRALNSEQGPEMALKFYSSFKDKDYLQPSEVVNSVYWAYAKKSPSEALESAKSLFTGHDRDFALREIATSAVSDNPDLGIQIATSIAEVEFRNSSMEAVFSEWLASDRAKAISELSRLPAQDLAAILREGDENSGIITNLAGSDPEGLIKMLAGVVVSSSNQSIFEMAVDGLAVNNPSKALELIGSLPESDMKSHLTGSFFGRFAASNPSAALSKAAALSDGRDRTVAYQRIGYVVGRQGVEEAIKLMQSVPPESKIAYLESAIPNLVEKEPLKVAGLIQDPNLTLDASTKTTALRLVGQSLCNKDPQGAYDWIQRLPANEQPYAMEGYARTMVGSDPQKLANTLSNYPRNETWAAGVKVLVENLRHSDPDASNKWQAELDRIQVP